MPQQLEFLFSKPRESTPTEQKEWIDGELNFWASIMGKIVIGISILQVSLLGGMLAMMWLIENTIAA